MSVAFIYNIDNLKAHITDFIQYQIDIVVDSIRKTDERIQKIGSKIKSLEPASNEKTRIELEYARQDVKRSQDNQIKQQIKYDALMRQLAVEVSKANLKRFYGQEA